MTITLADIQGKINVNNFGSDETAIRAVIEELYASDTARTMLESLVIGNRTIDITYEADQQGIASFSGNFVKFDLAEIARHAYLNTHGQVVQETLFTTLTHELTHVLSNTNDVSYSPGMDEIDEWTGEAVDLTNTIFNELSFTNLRSNYFSYMEKSADFVVGTNYSEGMPVNIAAVSAFNLDTSDMDDPTSDVLVGVKIGASENNHFTSGAGNDFLYGNSGNDTLDGGFGNDSITGGSDADTLLGGAGIDTLSYASAGSGVHIISTGADSSGITGGGSSGDANGDVFSGFEVYVGSAYNDEIDLHNTSGIGVNIYGGAGNDTIYGGSGDDILHGNDGADQLQGSAGDNFLIGDDGADQYYVGEDRGVDVISDEDGGAIILGSIDGGGTNVAFTGTADFISGTTWKLLGHTLHLAFGDLTITPDDSSLNYTIIIDDYDATQSNYFGFTLQDPHSGAGDDPEIGDPLDPNNPENAAHLGLDGVDDATGADGTLPWPDGTNFWRNDGDWGDDAPGISYFDPRADQVALDDEGHLFTPTLFERIFDAAIRTLANWTPCAADPLVLDLDNDGIELISLADSHAFFDIDSDNFDERTGWVGPDDALLVIDGNSNGTIDNIDELAAISSRQLGFAHFMCSASVH